MSARASVVPWGVPSVTQSAYRPSAWWVKNVARLPRLTNSLGSDASVSVSTSATNWTVSSLRGSKGSMTGVAAMNAFRDMWYATLGEVLSFPWPGESRDVRAVTMTLQPDRREMVTNVATIFPAKAVCIR